MNNKGLVSKLAIAAVLTGLGALPAQAADLKEALAAAYKSNPTLLAQREAVKATDETVARARSRFLPTVSARFAESKSKSNITSNTINPDTGQIVSFEEVDRKSYSLTARQNVFEGFRGYFGEKVARANVKAGRAQLLTVEQRVLLDGVTAYMDVLRDQAVMELNQNQVKVLERQLQASQDRFRVGEITRTDVAQSEARLEGAKSNLRTAEATLSASRARYTRVMGELPNGLAKPDGLPALPNNLEAAIDQAVENAPNVLAARYGEKAAAYSVKQSRGALYPTVDVEASITRSEITLGTLDRAPETSRVVGVQVNVPLYTGGANYADLRRAKRLRSQRMLQIREAERVATENAFVAWDNLRAATARITSSEAQVRASEIALEGVRQESAVGSRTTLDVLNQEQELLNAKVALIRAQRDEFVAAYNLLSATGRLTAKSLGLNVEAYDPEKHYKKASRKIIGG